MKGPVYCTGPFACRGFLRSTDLKKGPQLTAIIVENFWHVMATNDFAAASLLLSPDFEYYMPQTREYLSGRDAFVGLNETYPAQGPWSFDIVSLIAERDRVVSEEQESDTNLQAVALTFHTVREGLILRQIEYWPDDYDAPQARSKWVTQVATRPF